jgi:hypothetical protein
VDYLVMIEHSVCETGTPGTEFRVFRHPVANDTATAWEEAKRLFARYGDTVYMAEIIRKCIPAQHIDVPVKKFV